MVEFEKPADCTCEYPEIICRNMIGHPETCAAYPRLAREIFPLAGASFLSESERRLVELDKKKAEAKLILEDYARAVEAVVAEHGLNHYFQDADGTVYKTIVPEGRFVHYEKYAVCRTRRYGEPKGSLSLKEAEAAGFEVTAK